MATAQVTLNSEHSCLDDLCSHLFSFDRAVVRALASAPDEFLRGKVSQMQRLGFHSVDDLREYVRQAEVKLAGVKNPAGFRPSAKEGTTWVGRVLRIVNAAKPDELKPIGEAFAEICGLGTKGLDRQSLFGVLLRPTSGPGGASGELGRNLIVTAYAACQLVTAAAHADAYPRYPPGLLAAVSRDLRDALNSATCCLDMQRRGCE
jgi:hypothetical protein